MFTEKKKVWAVAAALMLASTPLIGGCGDDQAQQQQQQAKTVKAMMALRQDTPLTSEYAGQIVGKEEVKVRSKVSGNVVDKLVSGGQFVVEGQPLFRIDSRQYESAVLQAQATLAQSVATLNNAQTDLYRYQELLQHDAIEEQKVATQKANVDAYEAAAAANAAILRKAEEDLDDTIIFAPMTGQLSVDDVAIGTFVSAGNTTLVTIGSSDPVYAQFSISETEYLRFMNLHSMQPESTMHPISVYITLSDGTKYPIPGRIVETDRALADNTGTLTLKAIFDNPDGILLPGMFARVTLTGEVIPNAILVPQRAVQQLLGKSFVMVVGQDNKSEARTVTLGEKIGSYYIVKDGISANDVVVVEGLTNLREGMPLNVNMVTAEEMGFSLKTDTTPFVDSKPKSDASKK
ncbi:MAG TPA: efflux transporter periplasmic adaptor subunit [Selenomonas sp.]|nr:efflux transporter periplasmic adaptor subunit [Selenomonas sp.]